jgi:hypothetical protein
MGVWSYRAADYRVIQQIYKEGDDWLVKDYISRVYRFEDVTDDGEVFDPATGWTQMFFLEEDIAVIREAARVIYSPPISTFSDLHLAHSLSQISVSSTECHLALIVGQ